MSRIPGYPTAKVNGKKVFWIVGNVNQITLTIVSIKAVQNNFIMKLATECLFPADLYNGVCRIEHGIRLDSHKRGCG